MIVFTHLRAVPFDAKNWRKRSVKARIMDVCATGEKERKGRGKNKIRVKNLKMKSWKDSFSSLKICDFLRNKFYIIVSSSKHVLKSLYQKDKKMLWSLFFQQRKREKLKRAILSHAETRNFPLCFFELFWNFESVNLSDEIINVHH